MFFPTLPPIHGEVKTILPAAPGQFVNHTKSLISSPEFVLFEPNQGEQTPGHSLNVLFLTTWLIFLLYFAILPKRNLLALN